MPRRRPPPPRRSVESTGVTDSWVAVAHNGGNLASTRNEPSTNARPLRAARVGLTHEAPAGQFQPSAVCRQPTRRRLREHQASRIVLPREPASGCAEVVTLRKRRVDDVNRARAGEESDAHAPLPRHSGQVTSLCRRPSHPPRAPQAARPNSPSRWTTSEAAGLRRRRPPATFSHPSPVGPPVGSTGADRGTRWPRMARRTRPETDAEPPMPARVSRGAVV